MKNKRIRLISAGAVVGLILTLLLILGPARKESNRPSALRQFWARADSVMFWKQRRPNIVLIVLDTVRRDALSAYGNSRKTTPVIDSLASRGTTFTHAYSTSSWTLASHASMFTGLFSVSHGATQEHLYLEDDFQTLAEILGEAGYQTVGFSNNPHIGNATNMSQGFQEFYEIWRGPEDKIPGFETNAQIKKWFEADNARQPLFLFINYMEAHRPYWPLEKYRNLYTAEPVTPLYDLKLNSSITAKFLNRLTYSEADYEAMRALYDSLIKQLDDIVGQLLSILNSRGLGENTAIIITSDHGENIGEHDLVDHVFSLYDTTLQVPLLIYYPPLFKDGERNPRRVQLVDLFPTVLRIAGVDSNRVRSSGLDLADSSQPNAARPIFAEYYYPLQVMNVFTEADREHPALAPYKRRICSIESGGFKLIWGSDARHELYQTQTDPEELHNLAADSPEKVDDLSAQIQVFKKECSALSPRPSTQSQPQFDEETVKKLKALGYMQ